MSSHFTRRDFLQKSALASSAAALAFGFEEKNLLGHQTQPGPAAGPAPSAAFPQGKLGKLLVSRLICGGNLISGFAHSRDLIYVSPLLRHYFTDEKVFETWALCEAHGLNTGVMRLDENTLRLYDGYRKRGGKLQWIAQVKVSADDYSEIQQAVDHGALGVHVQGGQADSLVKDGQVEVLGKALDLIKKQGAVAGVAGHSLEVAKACEQAGLAPDFYMKTFNSKRYWSAGPMPRHDSVWEETPEETRTFMATVNRPWVAYKVLGAGAIHPNEGFPYAFRSGADFIVVGMFDFQVTQDVEVARLALGKARSRSRPWCG